MPSQTPSSSSGETPSVSSCWGPAETPTRSEEIALTFGDSGATVRFNHAEALRLAARLRRTAEKNRRFDEKLRRFQEQFTGKR